MLWTRCYSASSPSHSPTRGCFVRATRSSEGKTPNTETLEVRSSDVAPKGSTSGLVTAVIPLPLGGWPYALSIWWRGAALLTNLTSRRSRRQVQELSADARSGVGGARARDPGSAQPGLRTRSTTSTPSTRFRSRAKIGTTTIRLEAS